MSDRERDIHAIETWDTPSGYVGHATGARRSEHAVCYNCGDDITEQQISLYGSFCSGQCWAERRLERGL